MRTRASPARSVPVPMLRTPLTASPPAPNRLPSPLPSPSTARPYASARSLSSTSTAQPACPAAPAARPSWSSPQRRPPSSTPLPQVKLSRQHLPLFSPPPSASRPNRMSLLLASEAAKCQDPTTVLSRSPQTPTRDQHPSEDG